MTLTLTCRWLTLSLSTDKPETPRTQPAVEAKDGGLFELDGQADSRELFTRRLPEHHPTGVGFQRKGSLNG